MLPDRGAAQRDAPDVPTRYLSTQPCLSLKHTSTCTRTGRVLCLRHSGRANGATLFEGRRQKKIGHSRNRFIAKSCICRAYIWLQNGRLFQCQRTIDAHAIQKVQHASACGRTFHLRRPPWRLAHGIDHISHPK